MGVVDKVCLEDVEQTIAVEVGRRRPHSGLFAPIFVVSNAGPDADLVEQLSAYIVVIEICRGIACHENVWPPVVVEISSQGAEAVVIPGARNVHLIRNVVEMSVTVILIERECLRGQATRATHNWLALPLTLTGFARVRCMRRVE